MRQRTRYVFSDIYNIEYWFNKYCHYRNATVGVIDLFIFIDLSAVFAFLKIIANFKKKFTVEETHKI